MQLESAEYTGLMFVVVPEGEIVRQKGTTRTETVRNGVTVVSGNRLYLTDPDLQKIKLQLTAQMEAKNGKS